MWRAVIFFFLPENDGKPECRYGDIVTYMEKSTSQPRPFND
jgi:hypothetical protein